MGHCTPPVASIRCQAVDAWHRAGVGFLADVRRMNVAITRAKQALWILGAAATLSRNPVWAALLADATHRGVVIRDADARSVLLQPLLAPMYALVCLSWTVCCGHSAACEQQWC